MKAKLIVAAMLIAAVTLLPSCEESQSHATLRVNLRKDRSIVPADYPLEIETYRIIGDGPGAESFDVETSKETISLEGLVIGEWNITAEGLNSNDDVLVTGSAVHRLSSTNGSCTIILEDLVGTGSLEVEFIWDPERISGEPSIELELTPQYGTKETRELELTSMDKEEGKATYTGTDYPAGSYVLASRLYDGSVQVSGFVEAVRIAGDQVSKGTVEFDLDKYPTEPGTLEVVNNTGVPVSCVIEGLEDTVDADIPITVSISSETDDISSYSIMWYLDGNQIGEGTEVEITPTVGTHRLDVVASTSRLGTSGSASINFEALSITDPGVPSRGSIVSDSAEMELSGTSIVRFLPDGKVMIASNAEEKIHIASPIRGSLDPVRTYTYEELDITGELVDFDGIAVSDALSKIILLERNQFRVAVYNYNTSTSTLSFFSEGVPKYMPGEEDISDVGCVGYAEALYKDGQGVGAITVYAPFIDRWQIVYINLFEQSSDSEYMWMGNVLGACRDSHSPAGRIQSTDASMVAVLDDGCITFGMEGNREDSFNLQTSAAPPDKFPEYADRFNSIKTFGMSDEFTVMIAGEWLSFLTYDKVNTKWIYDGSIELGHEPSSMVVTKDFKYAYYIDLNADDIVTLEIISNGKSAKEIGRTALSRNGVDTLCLSRSGNSLIAYDADNASELEVFRITR